MSALARQFCGRFCSTNLRCVSHKMLCQLRKKKWFEIYCLADVQVRSAFHFDALASFIHVSVCVVCVSAFFPSSAALSMEWNGLQQNRLCALSPSSTAKNIHANEKLEDPVNNGPNAWIPPIEMCGAENADIAYGLIECSSNRTDGMHNDGSCGIYISIGFGVPFLWFHWLMLLESLIQLIALALWHYLWFASAFTVIPKWWHFERKWCVAPNQWCPMRDKSHATRKIFETPGQWPPPKMHGLPLWYRKIGKYWNTKQLIERKQEQNESTTNESKQILIHTIEISL